MGDNASVDSGNIDWNTEDVVEIENFCKSAHANLRIPDAGANGKAKLDEDAGDCAKVDVDAEDELEIQNITWSPLSNIRNPNGDADIAFGEASSSRGFSLIKMVDYFVQMGFERGMVEKAIEENGPENEDSIIESLLAYSALEDSPGEFQPAQRSSDNDEFWNDLSDADSYSDFEEDVHSEKEMLSCLAEMGYSSEEASIAIKTCGPDASMDELADFIYAARIAQEGDYFDQYAENNLKPMRKNLDIQLRKRRRSEDFCRSSLAGERDKVRCSNPMIGFGVPTIPELGYSSKDRKLSVRASGPPYFYFENVALAPRGVWDTMKRFLYDIEPEFVDSKYFCAAARKRGYIHNLPISHRFALLPHAPRKIQEAFPSMGKWWPYWDTRQHLNCLRTRVASDEDVKGVQKILEESNGNPPLVVQKKLLGEIRKFNLVWIGRNKVAKLEPREVEELLGLPIDHTRGISLTNRYKSLGNSFQVDTVAYHLSVLKDLFPGGMNVLSLFSGVGAAEVALHRLGIRMKNVVSVEIDQVNREVIQSWWHETDQKGKLIDKYYDVQHLSFGLLKQLICDLGGFDLVIGGSPCNNLTGSNRRSRTGLEGKDSALFYHYFRIVDTVKFIMGCM